MATEQEQKVVEAYLEKFPMWIEEYLEKENLDHDIGQLDGVPIAGILRVNRYELVEGLLDVLDEDYEAAVDWRSSKYDTRMFFSVSFPSLGDFEVFGDLITRVKVSASVPKQTGWRISNHKESDIKQLFFNWLKELDIY